MEVRTTRFGVLQIGSEDMLSFPEGLPGLEDCRRWVLLPDMNNDAVAWLQSTDDPSVALAVVSPRSFVNDYQLRVAPQELLPLRMADKQDAQVLTIVSVHEEVPTLNLKAPLVINRRNRLGRQVVANGELPLQYALDAVPARRRLAA